MNATRPATTVLVVEDELPIRQLLRTTLELEGYRVTEASTAREAEALAASRPIDVFLIDLGLPDSDGLTLIRSLRAWTQNPVLVLSARSQEHQKVAALDAGADDFVSKPFGVAELHARLRVALRHSARLAGEGDRVVRLNTVVIDLVALTVVRDGEPLRLTATQWRLLDVLARHQGSVVSSRQLLREVWGPGHEEQAHYLRIYIRQLRQKLEVDASNPVHILTESGLGYRLLPL
jgi:two-component system KDP operon response regulator KdpE